MPPAKHDIEDRRQSAYRQLNILPADVRLATPISSQLALIGRQLKKRKLPESPYYYLKCTNAPEALRIVELYYSIAKSKRDLVPIEAYCIAASVHPLTLLNVIAKACQQVTAQTSAMIAAINHPRVVEKTVEMALTDGGETDRMTLHKATGFIPTPRAPQTNIRLTQHANSSANSQSIAAPVLAPPPEQTIRRLVDRFHEARGLPRATIEPAILPESVGHVRLPADFTPKDIMVAVPVNVPAAITHEEELEEDEDT